MHCIDNLKWILQCLGGGLWLMFMFFSGGCCVVDGGGVVDVYGVLGWLWLMV